VRPPRTSSDRFDGETGSGGVRLSDFQAFLGDIEAGDVPAFGGQVEHVAALLHGYVEASPNGRTSQIYAKLRRRDQHGKLIWKSDIAFGRGNETKPVRSWPADRFSSTRLRRFGWSGNPSLARCVPAAFDAAPGLSDRGYALAFARRCPVGIRRILNDASVQQQSTGNVGRVRTLPPSRLRRVDRADRTWGYSADQILAADDHTPRDLRSFKLLIDEEDSYLRRRFGPAYLEYRKRVNELIPLPKL
jgi:hypothetical protein